MDVVLRPGDVFLTRGTGILSRLIRVCTQSFGESRSKVNHVGLVVEAGGFRDAMVVEALIKVQRHALWSQYGPPKRDHVAVFRAKNVAPDEMTVIVAEAEEQVGKKYGFGKIVAHFLDWLCFGIYCFRRIARNGDYPICSWLVAHAYAKAGYTFGVAPGAANPDDIWDFVVSRPEYYECIVELGSLRRFS